jgi:chromosome segregation ATPase
LTERHPGSQSWRSAELKLQRIANHPTDSQLIDRVTTLEAEKAALLEGNSSRKASTSSPNPQTPNVPTTEDTKPIARLRVDLAEALRAKGSLQTRLKTAEEELARLRSKTASDARALRDLAASEKVLSRKLRDREDELRQKNKLVADVQDELAVLNLQLNVAEQERKHAQDENMALVARWVKKMEEEAQRMNLANEGPSRARKR